MRADGSSAPSATPLRPATNRTTWRPMRERCSLSFVLRAQSASTTSKLPSPSSCLSRPLRTRVSPQHSQRSTRTPSCSRTGADAFGSGSLRVQPTQTSRGASGALGEAIQEATVKLAGHGCQDLRATPFKVQPRRPCRVGSGHRPNDLVRYILTQTPHVAGAPARSDAMALDEVVQRFVEQAPVAVMARLALERAVSAEWVDEVFEQHRQRQYTHELLFSTVVDLMSLVAVGLRPSLHAAAKASKNLTVSMTALYDKVNHVEPAVLQALVQGSAQRLAPVIATLRGSAAPCAPGYRVRIVDGNHLPASEKRLGPLRGFRGAALPGQSLVIFDPDLDLVVDLEPGEDAHAQERTMLPAVLSRAQPGDLWIADRNFSTRAAIWAILARSAAFLFREHSVSPSPTPTGPRREVGRIETGVVHEQPVTIPSETETGEPLVLRRIELELDDPTEDGDTT